MGHDFSSNKASEDLILLWIAFLAVAVRSASAEWHGPPHPCDGDSYDRDRYAYDPAAQRALLPLYLPYTHATPASKDGLQVEHVLSLREAHFAGMCERPDADKRAFAKDVRNQTLATAAVNNFKSSKSIAEWEPPSPVNRKWYAARVRLVAREWKLDLGAEAEAAIRAILERK